MLADGAVMNWLRETINNSQTGMASSKRIALLSGAVSMSIAVVVLAAAAVCGHEVAGELAAVCVPLAGLGGYSYVQGGKKEQTQ